METGPFRSARPAAGGASRRPEQTPRQASSELQVAAEPAHQTPPSHHRPAPEPRQPKRWLWAVIIAVAVVVVAAAGWFAWSSLRAGTDGIDKGKYQAVFFTNGQVYFGKLQPPRGDFMQLTNVYYLKADKDTTDDAKNPQDNTSTSSSAQLVKLGTEIPESEDKMVINKNQVRFYENLKPDSKIVQLINQYQDSKG